MPFLDGKNYISHERNDEGIDMYQFNICSIPFSDHELDRAEYLAKYAELHEDGKYYYKNEMHEISLNNNDNNGDCDDSADDSEWNSYCSNFING